MNTQKMITLFKNAGFIVETIANSNNILISLSNRIVDTMEAQLVLGDRRNPMIRVGQKVMIVPMTIKIR
jgi:hypothetical protein